MKSQNRNRVRASIAFIFVLCAVVGLWKPHLSRSQSLGQAAAPTPAWRPNREIKDARFAGASACAKCHAAIASKQHETAMGRALETPADCRILASHRELTFRSGPYTYRIVRQGNQTLYTITDGVQTINEPILFCFGQGKAGQTYLFQHEGSFYESRVSFFNDIQNLDYTIGYTRSAPPTLNEAAGRAISSDETRSCFACHATASVRDSRLQLDRMMPGVSCESCHGPGEKHALAMKEAGSKETSPRESSSKETSARETYIFNPKRMDADALGQEFCGACHRSVEQVSRMPQLGGGIHNVRFQPYRLFNSRGHDPTDERLSCTACHDPHDNPRPDAGFYDAKCFACHLTGNENPQALKAAQAQGRTDKPCPVARQDCAACHMPKVEIPGSHFKFTDHRIRIVKPGEAYPN